MKWQNSLDIFTGNGSCAVIRKALADCLDCFSPAFRYQNEVEVTLVSLVYPCRENVIELGGLNEYKVLLDSLLMDCNELVYLFLVCPFGSLNGVNPIYPVFVSTN